MQNYALVSFSVKIVIECSAIVIEIFSGTVFCYIVNFALWKSSF
ncbi:hypothetical protein J2772_003654 [Chryseobacterium jejuense]|nr:hypothetical protein [Chryseobacterium jejuense]